jgi:hypothetical protein
MRHLKMGKPMIRPSMPQRSQMIAPGSPDAQYLQNQYRAYKNPSIFTDAPESLAPIPRQNPLSDPGKFIYDKGRNRNYIFQGDTRIDAPGKVDQADVSRLVAMQQRYGDPFRVTSGYRGPNLNKKVEGAEHSTHLPNIRGSAFDIHVGDTSKAGYARLAQAAAASGFEGGYGAYHPGSLHVDTGNPRMWGSKSNKKTVMAGINAGKIEMAAGGAPPKATVLRAIKPVVKKGLGALKSVFAGNEIPVPRPNPRRVVNISPLAAGPQLQGGEPINIMPDYQRQQAELTQDANLQAQMDATNPNAPAQQEIYARRQPMPDFNALRTARGGGGGGLSQLPQASGKPATAPVVVQQGPVFSWVQWEPGKPPVQVPNTLLMQGMA